MRKILLLLAFLPSVSVADVVTYYHDVKGIQPGVTTYSDLIKKWGIPISEIGNKYGHHLKYEKITVTFSRSKRLVNTIIVYDRNYIDENGFSVGNSENLLPKLNTCLIYSRGHAMDANKGISYWSKQGRIEKIVYSASSVLDKEKIRDSGRQVTRQCGF